MKSTLFNSKSTLGLPVQQGLEQGVGFEDGGNAETATEEESRHLNCLFSITPFNVAGCI